MYGIKNKELAWFQTDQFGRQQSVGFEHTYSSKHYITCNVPQGSILGSLLFAICINDLHLKLEHCHVVMHADDAVVYYACSNSKVIESPTNKNTNKVAGWL